MSAAPHSHGLSGQLDPEHALGWRRTKAVVFFLIAAGALVWAAAGQWRAASDRALARTGAKTQGRVTELDSRRGGQVLRLSYEFTVNGTRIVAEKRAAGDLQGLATGGPIAVTYDPMDPARCITPQELTDSRFSRTPMLFAAVAAVLMTLAGIRALRVLQPGREPLED